MCIGEWCEITSKVFILEHAVIFFAVQYFNTQVVNLSGQLKLIYGQHLKWFAYYKSLNHCPLFIVHQQD